MSESLVLFDKKLERTILGAVLLETSAIARVGTLFRPELFFIGVHRDIASGIYSLFSAGKQIDITSVWIEVRKSGNSANINPAEITQLTNEVTSTAHLEEHVLRLTELFMTREVKRLAGEAISKTGDWGQDVFETISSLQKGLADMLAGTVQGGLVSMDRLIVETLKYIDKQSSETISGVPFGIPGLDAILFGVKPAELIILAARPACGKTAFARQICRHAARQGKSMAYFSLEMSYQQILQRDLAAESGVYFAKIQRNAMDDRDRQRLTEAASIISMMPMSMDDSFAANVPIIHSKCVQKQYRDGLDGIVIDYLQLIGGKNKGNQNREQQIAEISRGLKGMAKDLQVPVIALSQMSRAVETSGRREPQLSDLRESGAIEQDADTVIFLTPEEQEAHEFGRPRIIKAKIAKHRNGALDTIEMEFDGNLMRFSEPRIKQYTSDDYIPVHNSVRESDAPF